MEDLSLSLCFIEDESEGVFNIAQRHHDDYEDFTSNSLCCYEEAFNFDELRFISSAIPSPNFSSSLKSSTDSDHAQTSTNRDLNYGRKTIKYIYFD